MAGIANYSIERVNSKQIKGGIYIHPPKVLLLVVDWVVNKVSQLLATHQFEVLWSVG